MWFFAGIALSAGIIGLYLWLRHKRVQVRWYEWLIAGAGTASLLFGMQNYLATRSERWSAGTPVTFLLVFGLTALVLYLLSGFLIVWRFLRGLREKNMMLRKDDNHDVA